MPKNYILRIRLSSEELEKLRKKAESIGLEVSSFVRLVSLASQVKIEEISINKKNLKTQNAYKPF